MSSTPDPPTFNLMSRVPYDVLTEIFIHCLPLHPLRDRRQSNSTKIAPLLLCRICSSWRTVALKSTCLWSHLSYSFTICAEDVRSDLVKHEIEFIQWWRKNQGLIAPFICLSINYRRRRNIRQELTKDGMSFLLEYLMSAQYLELDPFYWSRIYVGIKAGNEFIFPNLHTLASSGWAKKPEIDLFHLVQDLVPPNTFSSLRRLCLIGGILPPNQNSQIPTHWSALTHISLHEMSISLYFWYSFIRAVPNLQWGYIDINDLHAFGDSPPQVSQYTLPHLSTFCVDFRDTKPDVPHTPFRLLLSNLDLPALRTLSLSWTKYYSFREGHDNDSATIDELYAVLNAMPDITTLALGSGFHAFDKPGSGTMTLGGQVEPIWKHLPHLVCLHLELPSTHDKKTEGSAERALSIFAQNIIFSSRSWLDLQNPACPIRQISIIDNDQIVPHNTEAFMMSCIEKYAEKLPNVVFQIISKTARQIAAEAWKNLVSYI